jgi:hypothetical protein
MPGVMVPRLRGDDEVRAVIASQRVAMAMRYDFAISPRSSREFCKKVPSSSIRGSRECRALDAPAALRAKVESTQASHHGHAGNTRHSPRNGFTAYSALSRVTGLSCHPRPQETCKKLASRELDASVGASGPHGFAVRDPSAFVSSAIRVHRIPSRVRDDREPPLQWDETATDKQVICLGWE